MTERLLETVATVASRISRRRFLDLGGLSALAASAVALLAPGVGFGAPQIRICKYVDASNPGELCQGQCAYFCVKLNETCPPAPAGCVLSAEGVGSGPCLTPRCQPRIFR